MMGNNHPNTGQSIGMWNECVESGKPSGLYCWDARLKIGLGVVMIALNIVLARLWLSVSLLGIGMLLAIVSGIPLRRYALFFLAPAWATCVVFIGFSVGFGETILFRVGSFPVYREGIGLGMAAGVRVACDMSWIAGVFLTTSFPSLMAALRWYRIPPILLDITAMAYRYSSLLWEEFQRMKISAVSRGGFRRWPNRFQSTGRILSQVILRSYDRSLRIQKAKFARGEMALQNPPRIVDGVDPPGSCPNRCDITPVCGDQSIPVLICARVCHQYGETRSLKDISMTVHHGEIVALCGPNGAGKSTLLQLIAGIIQADRGDVVVCGKKQEAGNRGEIFRQVGILFQDPNDQLFCTHVYEDIAYGPMNLGLDPEEIRRRVASAMDLMEVSQLASRPIHRLSHGEMRRVCLAGVIAMQPPLILLDEPTASLDPASTRHLIRLIQHLNSHHGYTLIMVTHDINIASMLATRVIVLDQGTIVADGTPREILTNRELLESSRLEPPLLTRLFQELDKDCNNRLEIPLTIEEALERFKKIGVQGPVLWK
jgi:cobalt/nickel transport system ATP-binding protein